MAKRVRRPGIREGYDLWSTSYDATRNPLVALDRRHTLSALDPQPGEWILDAGCGTGAHLRGVLAANARPVGLDFSFGMLAVSRRSAPEAALVQADLNRQLPVRSGVFHAFLTALVSEHLEDLQTFFREAFATLRAGGRMIFSAFHPEPARAGVEANFRDNGIEYRLGAEPYTMDEYLGRIEEAGFCDLDYDEFRVDQAVVDEVPEAEKHMGNPMLLIVKARRP
jgi:ubiquinone/menaquinone biosynthesis C-methylase UbiE